MVQVKTSAMRRFYYKKLVMKRKGGLLGCMLIYLLQILYKPYMLKNENRDIKDMWKPDIPSGQQTGEKLIVLNFLCHTGINSIVRSL